MINTLKKYTENCLTFTKLFKMFNILLLTCKKLAKMLT